MLNLVGVGGRTREWKGDKSKLAPPGKNPSSGFVLGWSFEE